MVLSSMRKALSAMRKDELADHYAKLGGQLNPKWTKVEIVSAIRELESHLEKELSSVKERKMRVNGRSQKADIQAEATRLGIAFKDTETRGDLLRKIRELVEKKAAVEDWVPVSDASTEAAEDRKALAAMNLKLEKELNDLKDRMGQTPSTSARSSARPAQA